MHPFRTEVINAMLPAAFLLATAAVIALHAWLRPDGDRRFFAWLGIEGALAAVAATFVESYRTRFLTGGVFLSTGGRSPISPGALLVDRYALVGVMLTCFTAAVLPLLVNRFFGRNPRHAAVFHALVLVAAAAAVLLAEQLEMVTLLVALTLFSTAAIAMLALQTSNAAAVRAAHKAAIIGGTSLAIAAYGLVLIYGVTGSTSLDALGAAFGGAPVLETLGVVLFLVGGAGIAGAGPLGAWQNAVGEAGPVPAVAAVFALGGPAVLVTLVRLSQTALAPEVFWWPSVIAVIGLLTAAVGALRAYRATTIRAVVMNCLIGELGIAVASIAGIGVGIGQQPSGGDTAVLLQAVAITVGFLGTFGIIGLAEEGGIGPSVEANRGLASRLGWVGGWGVVAFLGMTSLPPLGLFVAQLLGFTALVSTGHVWVVIIALVLVMVLTVPPLRLLAIVLDEPAIGADPLTLRISWPERLLTVACCIGGVLVLLFTGPLLDLISSGTGTLGPG